MATICTQYSKYGLKYIHSSWRDYGHFTCYKNTRNFKVRLEQSSYAADTFRRPFRKLKTYSIYSNIYCNYVGENYSSKQGVWKKLYYNQRPLCSSCVKSEPLNSITSVQNRQFSSVAQPQGYFTFLSESAPVAFTQDVLLRMHEFSGLPWWSTIVVTTIILRLSITVPLAIYQNFILAKVENLTNEMPAIVKELKVETAYAIKKFNWTEKQARITYNRSIKKQWNKLIIRENCHPAKASILLFAQLPMWVCLSVALRNLVYMLPHQDTAAQITCMELSVGGCLWVPNLLLPDASWILPVALGVTNLAIIELQTLSRVKKSGKLQKYTTNFFRCLSLAMIPVAASVPSCMNIYWVTSSIFGLSQNLILLSPRVKRLTGIPDTPSMLENPYKQIAEQIKEKTAWLTDRGKLKT